jgi:lysophospholipid acyltransferase (LPLAT)-like uncharacterized protein
LKQLLGNSLVQFLIGRTIGLYMLLVGVTTRWKRVNEAAARPFWTGNGKLVACIWHGRFFLVHKLWSFGAGKTKALFLISRSREGGIVSHASQTVGAEVIRGSAPKRGYNKGGAEAVREMVRHIESGGCMGMTPDGPKGPRMRAKLAPVQVAKLAQAPMMCLAWSTNWRIVFDSWDRFMLPLPFGRGALIWSDPIAPPSPDASDAEMEAVRQELEAEMNRIAAEADRLAGVAVIDPAPPRGAPAGERVEAAEAAT